MENQVVIEKIDFNNLNYVNIYLSIFFVCIFILFTISLLTIMNSRINKTKFSPDIISTITNSNDESIMEHMYNVIEEIVDENKKTTEKRVEKDLLKNQNMSKNIKNIMVQIDEIKQSSLNDNNNTYNMINNYIQNVNKTVTQVNDAYLANIDAMNIFYEILVSRMNAYLSEFSNILSTIRYQIDVAYVTPSLTLAIAPMKSTYNSIYGLFKNNADFVTKYIPNFDFSNIGPLNTKMKTSQNLFANFEKSNKIFE